MLDSSRRQNFLVGVPEGIRVVHRPRLGRGEHIRIIRVLLVFQDQQIHRLLRDRDGADGVAGLGLAHLQLSVDPVYLLGYRDGHILHIQISPEEGQQLTPAQAAGQLQVVGREEAALVGLLEVSADLFGKKYLHFLLLNFRELAPFRRVGGDEPFPHRLLQRGVEDTVDTSDEAVAQALVLQLNVLVPLDTPRGFQLVVELLDLDCSQFLQLDITDAGDNMLLDVIVVIVRRLLPDGRFGVGLKPQPHPLSHRVFATSDYVYLPVFLNGPIQFFLALFLRFGQDIFVNSLTCHRVATRCVAALPAAIRALAQAALSVCPFLSRSLSPPGCHHRCCPYTLPSS